MRSFSSGTRALISLVRALPCSTARLSLPSPMPPCTPGLRIGFVAYVRFMKWWGWGDDEVAFTDEDKPDLGPVPPASPGDRRSHVVLAAGRASTSSRCPQPRLSSKLRAALAAAVGAEHVSTEPLDRLVHARGKSLRDLVRHRRGELGRLPDVVVRPGGEDAVEAMLRAAIADDAVVIPFGGGSNISGSLEAPADETRTIVSVDMGRLDRVLAIDEAAAARRACRPARSARGWRSS